MGTLWDLFLDCLEDVGADNTFVVVDNIDVLGKETKADADEGEFVLQKLNSLVQDGTKLVKILLTTNLAGDQTSFPDDRVALVIPQRVSPLRVAQDELALVPHKLSEF